MAVGLVFLSQLISKPDDLRQLRIIDLKVAADEEFRSSCDDWCFYLKTLLRAASRDFEEHFGIRFRVKQVGSWVSDNSRQSPYGLINNLRSGIDKGKCDAVVGFTAQNAFETTFQGVCSYTQGYVLVHKGPPGAWIRNALKHELSHLFGAVDIDESNSLMDIQQRGDTNRFDEFSSALIRQNRDRAFQAGCFPLSGPNLDRVIEICLARHKKIPRENSVLEFLALLYLEKKDWSALKRTCLEAIASAPASVEAHNLMGLAFYRSEDYAAAVQEFKQTLRLEPRHPDAHHNLALSYLKSGRVDEAWESCEKALAVLPGSVKALGTMRDIQALQDQPGRAGSPQLASRKRAKNPATGKYVTKKKED